MEYLLNVVDYSGYSGISEVASISCDDPPRTKREATESVNPDFWCFSDYMLTLMQFLKAKSVVGQTLEISYLEGNFSLLAKFFVFRNTCTRSECV